MGRNQLCVCLTSVYEIIANENKKRINLYKKKKKPAAHKHNNNNNEQQNEKKVNSNCNSAVITAALIAFVDLLICASHQTHGKRI